MVIQQISGFSFSFTMKQTIEILYLLKKYVATSVLTKTGNYSFKISGFLELYIDGHSTNIRLLFFIYHETDHRDSLFTKKVCCNISTHKDRKLFIQN